jgi:hypothetical protein
MQIIGLSFENLQHITRTENQSLLGRTFPQSKCTSTEAGVRSCQLQQQLHELSAHGYFCFELILQKSQQHELKKAISNVKFF